LLAGIRHQISSIAIAVQPHLTLRLSCGLLVALRVETPLRRLGLTAHDALDHHGRDAREYGLGHRGSQDVGDRT
jgi:hypothetical protein